MLFLRVHLSNNTLYFIDNIIQIVHNHKHVIIINNLLVLHYQGKYKNIKYYFHKIKLH